MFPLYLLGPHERRMLFLARVLNVIQYTIYDWFMGQELETYKQQQQQEAASGKQQTPQQRHKKKERMDSGLCLVYFLVRNYFK